MQKLVIVVTSKGLWGKGESIAEAMKNAKVKSLPLKGEKVVIRTAAFDRETPPEEMEQLMTFWGVDGMGSVYRAEDLTPEDKALIEKRFVCWITDDGFCL